MSIRTISIRKGMFVLLLAMLLASGCSQRHILRMSNPELSTNVTLFEQGSEDSDDNGTTIVLDEPKRIAKVAAFFEARAEKWKPLEEEFRRKPQSAVAFRKGDQTTDRFWLERDRLCFQSPDGKYFTCDLSDDERAQLKSIFHFTTNFKSDE
jgi:hypothetical protein